MVFSMGTTTARNYPASGTHMGLFPLGSLPLFSTYLSLGVFHCAILFFVTLGIKLKALYVLSKGILLLSYISSP